MRQGELHGLYITLEQAAHTPGVRTEEGKERVTWGLRELVCFSDYRYSPAGAHSVTIWETGEISDLW